MNIGMTEVITDTTNTTNPTDGDEQPKGGSKADQLKPVIILFVHLNKVQK